MSIVSHGFERPLDWVARRPRMSAARKDQLKRVALRALAAFTMGSVLTAVIALKTAIFVWRLHA
ncbi:hypothetical protein [Bradyrhizobium monzae]|uniref:hypothetical protein n=1 Tax=Bradyrhizobium sp. Oc8 TaxID=2876780 RepID=UPI001F324B03|nr:hypothetical protein [Bradyrhizobium sp. Oc8]